MSNIVGLIFLNINKTHINWYKLDGNDMNELGKSLINDEYVLHFLNIVKVYQCNSVHIYVEHMIDEP
jgi:hypothetical protein